MFIGQDIDPRDLVEMIDEDLTQDEAFSLVCAIEEKICDVKFVERILGHFNKILKEECN